MIKELRDYSYKEICELMGEKVKSGASKRAQLKEWKRLFHWENPTKQKFRVTEIYEVPKEKNNNHGGFREGAGAKEKAKEEFEYLINMFFLMHYQRNSFNLRNHWKVAYFTNREISEYFGLFNENYYDALYDEKVNKEAFDEINEKISQKRRSLIIDKIKKLEGVTFCEGIIAYKSDNTFEYKDEYLEDWKKYQREYLEENNFKNIFQVITQEKWIEMIDYISSKFKGYKKVIKCHRVDFEERYKKGLIKAYDLNFYDNYKELFNVIITDELYTYYVKKEYDNQNEMDILMKYFGYEDDIKYNADEQLKKYEYIILKYIMLPENIETNGWDYINEWPEFRTAN